METKDLTTYNKLQTALALLIETGHVLNELGADLNSLSDKIHKLRELHDGKVPGGWTCDNCPVRDFATLDTK